MESLARLFVAATELVEAEGHLLKGQVVRLLIAAGLGLIIVVLVIAGLGFALFSLLRVLGGVLAPAGAALVVGVVALLLAWGGIVRVRRLLR
jgi:hypothetical protein